MSARSGVNTGHLFAGRGERPTHFSSLSGRRFWVVVRAELDKAGAPMEQTPLVIATTGVIITDNSIVQEQSECIITRVFYLLVQVNETISLMVWQVFSVIR
ncbi:hypothetical protein [Candidatus Sororendozoicomonas aggregata]|uniref:hypothetical protein n=1 Tax=Candidatus Sororendozoicomonas aggregata TaxID=3073239 RepID=UPI002ED31214